MSKKIINFGVFFIASVILIISVINNNSPNIVELEKKFPQEFMEDFTVTKFTETGNLKSKINSKKWSYIAEKKYSELSEPKIKIIKPNNDIWFISANLGKAYHPTINAKVDALFLLGNVLIKRPNENNCIPITMKTKEITYFPNKEQVETKAYVEMFKPGLKITGTGLKGYIDKNEMELLKDVTTIYEKTST